MKHSYDIISEQEIARDARFASEVGIETTDALRGEFKKRVETFINDGWRLQGGIAIDEDGYLLQAVYRDEED
jgi:hypothetical protein